MSTTAFAVNDAMAVKLWSKKTIAAERDTMDIQKLIGESQDSIIQEKTELRKSKGDQVTFALRAVTRGDGFGSGQKAQGNAVALTHYSDSVVINELGQNVGVRSDNTIDAQRVQMNLREEAKDGLVEWWRQRKSVSFFNQVCGYTPANTETVGSSGIKYTGLNPVTAPTSGRIIRAGAVANDQSLTSGDTFTVSLIDKAKEIAGIGDNIIRPVMIGGQPKYVMYLDPAQVTSLRINAGTGGWQDIAKAAMMGGEITKNPIYTGALGEWNGVVLRSSQDVTLGVNASTGAAISTVRRAVLLGAQAAVIGYGKSNDNGTTYRWSEELFDHGREMEVSAWSIWGLKKVVFNSADFGTLVVSTYAARAA
jgi:N4-gp56 family major capsid protein